MKARVLLITCHDPSPSSPSLGVTSIATHLLSNGVDVRIFDDGPYMLDTEAAAVDPREAMLSVQKTDTSTLFRLPYGGRFIDLLALVKYFRPDLVGVSATEATFFNAITYLDTVKRHSSAIKTVVGGAFAILAPDRVISEKSVDMVATGEGERSLQEYCERLISNDNPSVTRGLWIKEKDGSIRKNPLPGLIDINMLDPLRYDLYPKKRLLRPISGAVRRMLPLEISRGCVYDCTFCASPEFRVRFGGHGQWHRVKKIERVDSDIATYVKLYDPEYFFMISETFLAVRPSYFDAFIKMYSKYKIPFWMNTRPETITDESIGRLKDVGLERMSIGVECGNEKYRKDILNRNYSNSLLEKAFAICRKYEIKVTANIMIGLPDETREMIFDSIRLMRLLKPSSMGLCIFQPYKGTRLYKYAVDKKYCDPSRIINTTIYEPYMRNEHLSADELLKLLYTFNLYVKLDQAKWPLIDSLDMKTEEGSVLLGKLLKEAAEASHMIPTQPVAVSGQRNNN